MELWLQWNSSPRPCCLKNFHPDLISFQSSLSSHLCLCWCCSGLLLRKDLRLSCFPCCVTFKIEIFILEEAVSHIVVEQMVLDHLAVHGDWSLELQSPLIPKTPFPASLPSTCLGTSFNIPRTRSPPAWTSVEKDFVVLFLPKN